MASVTFLVLATNAYLPLGVRLVKRFNHFYTGKEQVQFRLFTDEPLDDYLPPGNWQRERRTHDNWIAGVSAKFGEIIAAKDCGTDYLYMLDADTSFNREFTLDWLLGETTGCEHFGNRLWMKDVKDFERSPRSQAFVPKDTPLPQMYYYGMIFGGRTEVFVEVAEQLQKWQKIDHARKLIARWHDESYLNKYFHYHPPAKVVLTTDFPWVVSDKGSLGDTRNTHLQIGRVKEVLREFKDRPLIDIQHGVVSAIS